MGKATYENIAKPSDYQFYDDQGRFGDFDKRLQGYTDAFKEYYDQAGRFDANSYMDQFAAANPALGGQSQMQYLADIISGQMNPLEQILQGLAQRQAALGGEAALAAMPGAANSGAGMAAFADAYASPFAQAQAQLQQQQLAATQDLWSQALGQNLQAQQYRAGLDEQTMQNYLQMLLGNAMSSSGIVAPQYAYQPNWWDRTQELASTAANVAGAIYGVGNIGDLFKKDPQQQQQVVPAQTARGMPQTVNYNGLRML